MKILTQEEEQAHYNATVKGGLAGMAGGLALGGLGMAVAARRYSAVRALTVPFRTFLVASTATFGGIICADRASAQYDLRHNPEKQRLAAEEADEASREAAKPASERARAWAAEHRYPLLGGFWVLSLGASFALVNRNRTLSGAQKLVQARVYAQSFTLAALVGSFAFETTDASRDQGRWETVKVLDPNDPQHKHLIEKRIHHERYPGEDQWQEMVEAEERRLNERKAAAHRHKEQHEKERHNKEHDKERHDKEHNQERHDKKHEKAQHDQEQPEPEQKKEQNGHKSNDGDSRSK